MHPFDHGLIYLGGYSFQFGPIRLRMIHGGVNVASFANPKLSRIENSVFPGDNDIPATRAAILQIRATEPPQWERPMFMGEFIGSLMQYYDVLHWQRFHKLDFSATFLDYDVE